MIVIIYKFIKVEKKIMQKVKKLVTEIIIDCIGAFFIAISVYVFAKNANFAPGGVNGASVIINHLSNLPIGTISLVINIPIILLSYKFLGVKFLLKSLKTMVICAVFMDYVVPFIPAYKGNELLAAIFTGGLGGIGYALIYMQDSSTGGSDFLIMTAKKLMPHKSIGQITQAIDGSVIIIGGFIFGINAVLYGIISTVVSTIVIDKIMYGEKCGKLAIIITEKGDDLTKRIDEEVSRGSTIINAIGSYTRKSKNVILCACSKSQVYPIRALVKEVDNESLMIITEYNEVYGYGFLDLHKE